MDATTDWGTAVVVDPRALSALRDRHDALRRTELVLKGLVAVLAAACAFSAVVAYRQAHRISDLHSKVSEYRRSTRNSERALGALARSHESILEATEKAPSIGTNSWGHRFTVTMYVPRSEAYGKFNDGLTATMKRADPGARIVAVDPKLIPYGSSVWIERLGWFTAEDCGSAIKGYRLDVLTATEREAFEYGKQDRFVIVIPPGNA